MKTTHAFSKGGGGKTLDFDRLAWCPRLLTAVCSMWLLSGCSTPDSKADCTSRPGYQIVVTATEGVLPADLKLRLDYDAGCEVYDLSQRLSVPCNDGGETGVLFCSPEGPDAAVPAADASAAPFGLTCMVWGVGAGTVQAMTKAYPTDPLELGRDAVGCDPTVIPIVLSKGDAGP